MHLENTAVALDLCVCFAGTFLYKVGRCYSLVLSLYPYAFLEREEVLKCCRRFFISTFRDKTELLKSISFYFALSSSAATAAHLHIFFQCAVVEFVHSQIGLHRNKKKAFIKELSHME